MRTDRPWRLALIVVGVCAIAIALGLVVGNLASAGLPPRHPSHSEITDGGDSRTSVTRDMRGNAVALDPGATPIPGAAPVSDTGVRFQVPSVGLDVPLGAINEVSGSITPPGFSSAYWVRNMGVPLSRNAAGSTYVVMHALRGGGRAPGNYLEDVSAQSSRLAPGALITVDGHRFSVTRWSTLAKSSLANDADVWDPTPARLVVITCLENTAGTPATENLVIEATAVP